MINGHSGTFDSEITEETAITELQFWIQNDSLAYLGIIPYINLTPEELDNFAKINMQYIHICRINGSITFICY